MDPAYYEDLAGRLYGLVIVLEARLVLQPHLETLDPALVMEPPGAGLVAATPV